MTNKKTNEPSLAVTVFNSRMQWLREITCKEVTSGFQFTEGAIWHPGQFFLFSDTPANMIYKLSVNGDIETYLNNSGLTGTSSDELSDQLGSNGLAADKEENIFICQHGNHAIAKLNNQRQLTTVVNEYLGRPFNSPNDIILHSNGTIFFTDPPYGLMGQVLHPERLQPLAGIYSYGENGCQLIGSELQYPNGLFFSLNEEDLYVSSNFPGDPGILRYKINTHNDYCYDGVWMRQHADGMTVGPDNLIYLATDEGILIVSPEGKKLALISLPQTPSNCCWGGAHHEVLLITARTSLYMISKTINEPV